MRVALVVEGDPAPKGSRTHFPNGGSRESSKRVKPFLRAVKLAAERESLVYGTLAPPYCFAATFYAKTPKSPKYPWPGSLAVGDLDKLVRCVLDGLEAGRLIAGDQHVIRFGHIEKLYAGHGRPPYAEILVESLA